MAKRGGRGGSMAQLASALGIQRQDIGSIVNQKREDPKLYPLLSRTGTAIEMNADLQYMVDMKKAMIKNFENSEFYRNESLISETDKSYSDKYLIKEKDIFVPHLKRVPLELHGRKTKEEILAARRKKLDYELGDRLDVLESKEANGDVQIKRRKIDLDDDDEPKEDDEAILSDDDYLEEDNDYATTYFDNGENYGDGGSDDNLEDM
uniref:DNA-directed RNA polymerase III subunit n=1 Tax=Rhabditophanes sp. KR3021 TaxID=114890 RepID=A0AC35UBI5_9BILA